MTRRGLIGVLTVAALAASGADKSLPNQAGNAKVGLVGTAITNRKDITSLMGIDMGEGFVVVKIRVIPQTSDKLRISIDDFTLVSRKNGEKSGALAPSSIAGGAVLVVAGARSSGGGYTNGMGMPMSKQPQVVQSISGPGEKKEDPRMAPMEEKILKDRESTEPVEGLLYFTMEGKLQPKDLGLIYAGPAGRLAVDFK